MTIKGILVTMVAPMADHIANGGEKLLGNASSIKKRMDGRVYISGQKQRHALFAAMDRLNENTDTFISNGDGITNLVEKDLRADLGGFLHTSKESYSGRRMAPITATPAVAHKESKVSRDLLVRLKVIQGEDSKNQALATREFSDNDEMVMSFHIDVGAIGIRKKHIYENEMHIKTEYVPHIDEVERKRRIALTLEASNSLNDYANNARNATSGEPNKVLIIFDAKLSRKAIRYFTVSDIEKQNILTELKNRNAVYFLGDDTVEPDNEVTTVEQAYKNAMKYLDTADLYNPAKGERIQTTEEFENVLKIQMENGNKEKKNKEKVQTEKKNKENNKKDTNSQTTIGL